MMYAVLLCRTMVNTDAAPPKTPAYRLLVFFSFVLVTSFLVLPPRHLDW